MFFNLYDTKQIEGHNSPCHEEIFLLTKMVLFARKCQIDTWVGKISKSIPVSVSSQTNSWKNDCKIKKYLQFLIVEEQ